MMSASDSFLFSPSPLLLPFLLCPSWFPLLFRKGDVTTNIMLTMFFYFLRHVVVPFPSCHASIECIPISMIYLTLIKSKQVILQGPITMLNGGDMKINHSLCLQRFRGIMEMRQRIKTG